MIFRAPLSMVVLQRTGLLVHLGLVLWGTGAIAYSIC